MMRKIFLTEWKEHAFVCAAGLIVCLIGVIGYSLAGIGAEDWYRADLAEGAFAFLNIASYAVPLILLVMAIFAFRSYYRQAGLTEGKIVQGALFNLFVWTTIFLAALMLLATAFDFAYFAGAEAVRGQTVPQCMLLSLREHGVYRLLFAPSVAVTMSLFYVMYDLIRLSVLRPRHVFYKILLTVLMLGFLFLYQYMVYCAAVSPGILLEASWLVPPDSVLPVVPALAGGWGDDVKNVHYFAAPILNLIFIAGELCFAVLYYGFVKVAGRCKNEMEES